MQWKWEHSGELGKSGPWDTYWYKSIWNPLFSPITWMMPTRRKSRQCRPWIWGREESSVRLCGSRVCSLIGSLCRIVVFWGYVEHWRMFVSYGWKKMAKIKISILISNSTVSQITLYSAVIPYKSGITMRLRLSILWIRASFRYKLICSGYARLQKLERPWRRVIPDM